MKPLAFVILCGSLLLGCWTRRPPTNTVDVVTSEPEGAIAVGPRLPWWVGSCASPPLEVVTKAESWGATALVVVARRELRDGRSFCEAHGVAAP